MTGLTRQNDQIDAVQIGTGPLLRWTMAAGAGAVVIALLCGGYLAFQSHQASRPPMMISTPETIGPTTPATIPPATLGQSKSK
jgi:hypothetical protein